MPRHGGLRRFLRHGEHLEARRNLHNELVAQNVVQDPRLPDILRVSRENSENKETVESRDPRRNRRTVSSSTLIPPALNDPEIQTILQNTPIPSPVTPIPDTPPKLRYLTRLRLVPVTSSRLSILAYAKGSNEEDPRIELPKTALRIDPPPKRHRSTDVLEISLTRDEEEELLNN